MAISSHSTSDTEQNSNDSSQSHFDWTGNDHEEVNSVFASPVGDNSTYIDFRHNSGDGIPKKGKRNKYWRFELYNRGTHNGKWKDKEKDRRQDRWYFCENIASQIELTDSLKTELCNLYLKIDLRRYERYEWYTKENDKPRRKEELVVFCICVLLHNREQTPASAPPNVQKYYPGKSYDKGSKYGAGGKLVSALGCESPVDRHHLLVKFAQEVLQDQLGLDDHLIKSCMEKVRSEHRKWLSPNNEG